MSFSAEERTLLEERVTAFELRQRKLKEDTQAITRGLRQEAKEIKIRKDAILMALEVNDPQALAHAFPKWEDELLKPAKSAREKRAAKG